MAKSEITVHIADLPQVKALVAELRGRAETAERALAALRQQRDDCNPAAEEASA